MGHTWIVWCSTSIESQKSKEIWKCYIFYIIKLCYILFIFCAHIIITIYYHCKQKSQVLTLKPASTSALGPKFSSMLQKIIYKGPEYLTKIRCLLIFLNKLFLNTCILYCNLGISKTYSRFAVLFYFCLCNMYKLFNLHVITFVPTTWQWFLQKSCQEKYTVITFFSNNSLPLKLL